MEKGLISFEKHHIRERFQLWTEYLRRRGVAARFGGVGEGTGLGGGTGYTISTGEQQYLTFLGLATFRGYEEFDSQWTRAFGDNKVVAEASYQWRPEENFYGLGHASLKEKHSNFALRQSWAGLRWEIQPAKRLRWGALYKLAWLSALPGQAPGISSPDVFFSDLTGYGTQTRLGSAGAYFDADLFRGEYSWGGSPISALPTRMDWGRASCGISAMRRSWRAGCRWPPGAARWWDKQTSS